MAKLPNIGIIGATGTLGTAYLAVLDESDLKLGAVRLFASAESAGELYKVRNEECQVEALDGASFTDLELVVLAAPQALVTEQIEAILASKAFVIDATGALRGHPDARISIPASQAFLPEAPSRIAWIPKGAAVQLARILLALQAFGTPRQVVTNVFQPVAGSGRDALDEFWQQTVAVCNQREIPTNNFQHQLAFNCVPQVDMIADTGFTRIESETASDVRALLGAPELSVHASFTRVPVFHGQALSTFIELNTVVTQLQIVDALSAIKDFEVWRDPHEYPMPLTAVGSDELHIGRVRVTDGGKGCWLWSVADELHWAAAKNMLGLTRTFLGA